MNNNDDDADSVTTASSNPNVSTKRDRVHSWLSSC
jgi:hypothetical protein